MSLRRVILHLTLFLGMVAGTSAVAQGAEEIPDECRIAPANQAAWTRCLEVAESGSAVALFAHANLGTIAAQEQDFETALHHYDLTIVPGQNLIMDASLHGFRSQVFRRAGRTDEALQDAERVLWFIDTGYADLPRSIPLNNQMRSMLYELVLRTLVASEAPQTNAALSAYLELPTENWIDVLNRSTIFLDIERYDMALTLAREAVNQQPNHPATHNNVCYILALMDRGEDALPSCEQAMALAPNNAAIIDSYAVALSNAGRCEEAVEARLWTRRLEPSNTGYHGPLACELN